MRYLELPEDEGVSVDLEQAAVILLCHLDRLAVPHNPPLHTPHGRPTQGQEVRVETDFFVTNFRDSSIVENSLQKTLQLSLVVVNFALLKIFIIGMVWNFCMLMH